MNNTTYFEHKNDLHTSEYTVLRDNSQFASVSYKRKPDERDRAAIFEKGQLVQPGEYYGEWYDNTDNYNERVRLAQGRNKIPTTKESLRAQQIREAQRLLDQLLKLTPQGE